MRSSSRRKIRQSVKAINGHVKSFAGAKLFRRLNQSKILRRRQIFLAAGLVLLLPPLFQNCGSSFKVNSILESSGTPNPSPNTSGGSPVPGAGGSPVASGGTCVNTLPERRVWPLSRSEFDNTINFVLGLSSNLGATTFPPEIRGNGYTSNTQNMSVDSRLLNLLMNAAETTGSQTAAQELNYITNTLGCTPSSSPSSSTPDSCAVKYIQSRGQDFFRRPLSGTEVTDLYSMYLVGFQNPDPGVSGLQSAVGTVLTTMLQMPEFFYRTEMGSDTDNSSPVAMTQFEIASAISYMSTGFPPDAALMSLAASGGLNSPSAISSQFQRLLNTASGHDQMGNFVLQWMASDQVQGFANSGTPLTSSIAADMVTETKKFVEEALFNGSGTLSELLSGRYTFANSELASYYGLSAPGATSNFTKIALDSSQGRSGVFSQGSFLVTSAKGGVPLLHRGKLIRNRVLCHDLPAFSEVGLPGFTPPPAPTPSPGVSSRSMFTTLIPQGSACYTCHQYFMPMGFAFENFDVWGAYRTTDNGAAIDPSGVIVSPNDVNPATGHILNPESNTSSTFTNFADLMNQLAASPTANSCFAYQIVLYLSGSSTNQNDCSVATVLGSTTSASTIQTQLLNYLQSSNFIYRSR